MRPALLAFAAVATLSAAPGAGAATYCVDDPKCPAGGIAQPSPQAALEKANADAGADTVRVGPGVYAGPVTVREQTTLAGAGRAATVFIGPAGGNSGVIALGYGTVRDLGVRLGNDARLGIGAYGDRRAIGRVERVDVDGSDLTVPGTGVRNDDSIEVNELTLSDVRVVMAQGVGIDAQRYTVVEDSSVQAPLGIRSGGGRYERVLITGTSGLVLRGGNTEADALAVIVSGASAQGVVVADFFRGPGLLDLRHGTIIGSAGRGTGLQVDRTDGCLAGAVNSVTDTAIQGFAKQIAVQGPGDCPKTVYLALTRTAYDPFKVEQTGSGALTSAQAIETASLGLNSQHVPQPGSRLLDAGDPAEQPGLDLRGLPRPFSGTVADVGAFEYQGRVAEPTPPGPTPTATSTPPAPTPTPTRTPTPPRVRAEPQAVRVQVRRVGRLRYRVHATVVRTGGIGECEGAKARFRAIGRGSVLTTFDADCHADITVRGEPGTRLRVRFGGTSTLKPKRSDEIVLPGRRARAGSVG